MAQRSVLGVRRPGAKPAPAIPTTARMLTAAASLWTSIVNLLVWGLGAAGHLPRVGAGRKIARNVDPDESRELAPTIRFGPVAQYIFIGNAGEIVEQSAGMPTTAWNT